MKTEFTYLLNHLTPGALHDGWMHVCPLGEHVWKSADGKESIIQVIDREGCELMARAYPLSALDAMVDREHSSMSADGDTAALGWGTEAQVRDDGLWVKAAWTPTGRSLVEGKEYKFNSPCFPRDGAVHLGGDRYRITKLGRIALTNNPNLRGQTPLTNSRTQAANPNPNTPTQTMDYKSLLMKVLGLDANATDDQIASACSGLKDTTTTAMNARIVELENQFANSVLDANGIKDESQRKLLTPMLINRDTNADAMKLVETLKAKAAAPAQQPIHNRGGAPLPQVDLTKAPEGAEDAKAAEVEDLHNRARVYRDTHKVSYEAALAAVRTQKPAK
jgi:phage I-like protein